MIESEVELQFKLIDYLRELYHSSSAAALRSKAELCFRVIEQLRVVHDQVIPLLDDHFCEGVLLNELAVAARKVGSLKRKETLYKYLAMKKFALAQESSSVIQIFGDLNTLTRCGFKELT